MPYGETFAEQSVIPYRERFRFTGKERDEETNYDYFGARYYSSAITSWLSVDPLSDKYPDVSPYAYCSWNPMNKIDPDGRDEEQRNVAIDMANQYVKMNPGNSYKNGAKGGPGEYVDCSGLVSHCIVAGGEEDPVGKGIGNGVRQIATLSQKIDNVNDIESGNIVTFNTETNGDYSHVGIISEIIRDDNGNVVDFQFIHSGSKGPTLSKFSQKYWNNKVSGFYKWDTKPDVHEGPMLPQISVYGSKPNIAPPTKTISIDPRVILNINFKIK